MNFRVRQKVVCLYDFASISARYGMHGPTKGQICTIRNFEYRAGLAIRIEEITNPPVMCSNGIFAEISFTLEEFRPLVEKKTDISVFTAMLNSEKVDA